MNKIPWPPTIAKRAWPAVNWLAGLTALLIVVFWLTYTLGEGQRRHVEQIRICALQVDYDDCMSIRTDDQHYPFKLARKMDYERADALERATMRNEDCDLSVRPPNVQRPSSRSFPGECEP
jgi:hypothetical protein